MGAILPFTKVSNGLNFTPQPTLSPRRGEGIHVRQLQTPVSKHLFEASVEQMTSRLLQIPDLQSVILQGVKTLCFKETPHGCNGGNSEESVMDISLFGILN
ncbi:MAG TPA: hypothetical protein VG347_13650 [Verrucomicrobiae bacterium]|nr:hypothetical protein [Verrucomicrobiae bacterium]